MPRVLEAVTEKLEGSAEAVSLDYRGGQSSPVTLAASTIRGKTHDVLPTA